MNVLLVSGVFHLFLHGFRFHAFTHIHTHTRINVLISVQDKLNSLEIVILIATQVYRT